MDQDAAQAGLLPRLRRLNWAWAKPIIFLCLLLVGWDLAIRIFQIPAYQIPAPKDVVTAFWEEMDAAGADWHFHSYSGVKHGFTDPGSDARGLAAIAYDASADRQSWAAMLSLFDEVFE